MTTIAVGETVGQDLCGYFGIDPHKVVSLKVHVNIGEPVILEVEEYADIKDPASLQARRFELTEVEP